MDDENYGINKEFAHPKAIELIPEEFFWSCIDELAPFGSDEGDMALAEFREWKIENPKSPLIDCLKWTIESVGEINFEDYNSNIIDRGLIKAKIEDDEYDEEQYINTLDISVIATGFGQLVDEGKIDFQCKPYIKIAIERQKVWAELSEEIEGWEYAKEYKENLIVLDRVLKLT